MSNSFDGAGKPYRGPSFRAPLILLAAVIVAITLSWLGVSWAMNNGVSPPPGASSQASQSESELP